MAYLHKTGIMSLLVYLNTLTLWRLKREREITLEVGVVRHGKIKKGKGKNTGLEVSHEVPDRYYGEVLRRR
jgi:hypothetical protein